MFLKIGSGSVRRALVLALVLGGFALTACVSVHDASSKASPPVPFTTVQFQTIPDTAEVWIDGEFRGTTQVSLALTAGEHRVEFRLGGFQTWSRTLVVVPGDDTRVSVRLQPE